MFHVKHSSLIFRKVVHSTLIFLINKIFRKNITRRYMRNTIVQGSLHLIVKREYVCWNRINRDICTRRAAFVMQRENKCAKIGEAGLFVKDSVNTLCRVVEQDCWKWFMGICTREAVFVMKKDSKSDVIRFVGVTVCIYCADLAQILKDWEIYME